MKVWEIKVRKLKIEEEEESNPMREPTKRTKEEKKHLTSGEIISPNAEKREKLSEK